MKHIPSIKDVCRSTQKVDSGISANYLLDLWLLDLKGEMLYLYSPMYGHQSEKFLVSLDRLREELPKKKKALLLYENSAYIIYIRANIGLSYENKQAILKEIIDSV